MIPILYETTETAFTTNGIGRLTDAISCYVTEERNGIYELEMVYPVDGNHYEDISISRIIAVEVSDGTTQAFRIYKISRPLNMQVTINCEHISYQLSYIPVMPFSATNVSGALNGILSNSAETNPFSVWTDKTTDATYNQEEIASARERLGGVEGSILDVYGGEYEFDNWTVKLWASRGSATDVVIRYGKNLVDLNQEENIEAVYTGIAPYWKGEEDGETVLVTLPEQVLHSSNASLYPFQRTIPLDLTEKFEEQPTESELRTAAQNYIDDNNIGVPKVSISFSFVALWQTEEYKNIASLEQVKLCDTISVVFEKLGVNAQAQIIRTEWDVLLGRYTSMEIGDAQTTLADTIIQQEETVKNIVSDNRSRFGQLIDDATATISGAYGGNVVINTDASGRPYEILIMDSDDIGTAQKIIRANYEGIGFSQTGYNGTFTSAWLIDGTFDAQNINVVNFVADYIAGGTLKLGGNVNGSLQLYDASENLIGSLTTNGLKMYGTDGSYVLFNNTDGVAGYNSNNEKIYWLSDGRFYMSKAEITEEITLASRMRFIGITQGSNDGIALVTLA